MEQENEKYPGRRWWSYFEKVGGALLLFGGVVAAASSTIQGRAAHPSSTWAEVGIGIAAVGLLLLLIGITGQLRNPPPPPTKRRGARMVHAGRWDQTQ